MVIIVVVGAAIIYASTRSLSGEAHPDAINPVAPIVPQSVRIGDVGVLHSPDGQMPVYLFEKRDDFDEFQKALIAKDLTGVNQVLVRSTTVTSGTRARAIEADWWKGAARVRIEGGPHAGLAGWAVASALRPE